LSGSRGETPRRVWGGTPTFCVATHKASERTARRAMRRATTATRMGFSASKRLLHCRMGLLLANQINGVRSSRLRRGSFICQRTPGGHCRRSPHRPAGCSFACVVCCNTGRWGVSPSPMRGFRPLGFIGVWCAYVPQTCETSHLRVVRRYAALPTGQPLPSGAFDPDQGYALNPLPTAAGEIPPHQRGHPLPDGPCASTYLALRSNTPGNVGKAWCGSC